MTGGTRAFVAICVAYMALWLGAGAYLLTHMELIFP